MRAPAAVHVVAGYSQAGRFDGLIVEDRAGPIVVKARWQPMARAAMLYENGRISEWLTRLLLEMRQLFRVETPIDTPFAPLLDQWEAVGTPVYFKPRDPERLVLLFYVGEPDLMHVAHALYPRYDFEIDPQTSGFDRIPPDSDWDATIDTDIVREMLRHQFSPLFNALLALRKAGFDNVYFHDAPPPPLEPKPHWKPYRLRFKLTVLANEVFKEFAVRTGIDLISTYDSVTRDGVRDARYDEGDGVHLSREAAMLSIERLHQTMSRKPAAS